MLLKEANFRFGEKTSSFKIRAQKLEKQRTHRDDAISGGKHENISAGDDARALSLQSFFDVLDVPEIPHPEAPVCFLLRHHPPRRVQQQRRIARLRRIKINIQSIDPILHNSSVEINYLDEAVMEDVPEPGEGGVFVALVEELDLLLDDFLGLRA